MFFFFKNSNLVIDNNKEGVIFELLTTLQIDKTKYNSIIYIYIYLIQIFKLLS